MNFWQIAYDWAGLPLARGVTRLCAPFKPKISRGLAGRRRSFAEIENYLSPFPGGAPALRGILFHATSVGEYLQALPLMQELKSLQPDRPLYLSFFSPSVEKQAHSAPPADLAFFLPEDTRSNISRLLGLLNPELVIISKFDIWPNLVTLASRAGIPVAVIAATLSPDSGRFSGPAAWFHRSFYRHLSLVCAISEQDSVNYRRLGVNPDDCVVTGDTRFDQTFRRASGITAEDPNLLPFRGWGQNRLFACGSTWSEDEEHLIPALAGLYARHASLRAILAPHEPSPAHVEKLASALKERSISFELFSNLGRGGDSAGPVREVAAGTRAVLVDRTGVLAAVYRAAHIVYVGGSFGSGVHNVMEPACFGLPVLFGPRHLNSYEARLMLERGGAFAVAGSDEITQLLDRLLTDEKACRTAGENARAVIRENLGATERTLRALSRKFRAVVGDLPGQTTGV